MSIAKASQHELEVGLDGDVGSSRRELYDSFKARGALTLCADCVDYWTCSSPSSSSASGTVWACVWSRPLFKVSRSCWAANHCLKLTNTIGETVRTRAILPVAPHDYVFEWRSFGQDLRTSGLHGPHVLVDVGESEWMRVADLRNPALECRVHLLQDFQ